MPVGMISNRLIAKLKPQDKLYELRDSHLIGFMIRVYPNGKMESVT